MFRRTTSGKVQGVLSDWGPACNKDTRVNITETGYLSRRDHSYPKTCILADLRSIMKGLTMSHCCIRFIGSVYFTLRESLVLKEKSPWQANIGKNGAHTTTWIYIMQKKVLCSQAGMRAAYLLFSCLYLGPGCDQWENCSIEDTPRGHFTRMRNVYLLEMRGKGRNPRAVSLKLYSMTRL